MSSLGEFISEIREAESIEVERIIINNELADMRTKIRECDLEEKPKIIAKLIYLSITGEKVSWGQIDAVSLMSNDRLSYKRLGYLAVQTIFDEQSEILVLITQTLHRDLNSTNPLIQAFPLTFIANMGTAEMCQSVYTDVERLTSSIHPGIVKRAGMASVRIVRKVPELASSFKKALTRLLSNTKHSVVSSGVTLAIEMMAAEPSYIKSWAHFAKPFTQLLSTLSHSRPTAEFRMAIFNDPFLQIKTLKLLGMLRQPSDELDEALTFLVTTVDARRNTGRSLLLQGVETIGLAAKKQSLTGLAFNQIGRLLNNKEPNVLYSVLSAFSKILYNGAEIIDRSSRDSLALQRYKSQIVHCLDYRDPSIRRRALDVILALVNSQNAETLVPEIIEYLPLTDSDFRSEMIVKLYFVVQRFAPTPIWHFDIIHMLLIDSGSYVGNDILTAFCRLIATNEDVRNHALVLLENTLSGYTSNQALIKVSAFVLGEYLLAVNDKSITRSSDGDSCSLIDTMISILKMPLTQTETKCYLITAITKLSARLKLGFQKVSALLNDLSCDNEIEVQQRSGEMKRILQNPQIWEDVLAPPEYKKTEQSTNQKTAQIIVNKGEKTTQENQNAVSTNAASQTTNLLDLIDNGNPVSSPANIVNPTQTNTQGGSIIDDLLSLAAVPSSQQQNQTNPIQQQNQFQFKPPPNSVEAIRNQEFVVYFEISKNPSNPKQIAIRSTIANLGPQQLKNFSIQYGVPVGWVLTAQPQNGSNLEPYGQNSIQQVLYLENRGSNPLMMKTHSTFFFGCQPIQSSDNVNPIF